MKTGLYIVWNKENEIGIPIIDEQHRAIVSMINSLFYFMQENHAMDVLMPTTHMITEYALIHFNTEEPMMQRAGYKDYDHHRALHHDMIKKSAAAMVRSTRDKDPSIMLRFLKDWWLHHINMEDRQYMALVRRNEGLDDSG